MSSTSARILATIAVALFFFSASTFAADQNFVGSVKSITGEASIQRNGAIIPAKVGSHLFKSDTLRTSAGGSMGVILQDGTRISLGSNTELSVNDFLYQPEKGQFSLILKLVRGVLAYVSGKIASFSPASVKVETPVGTVGLRGTKFAISLDGT